MANYPDLVMKKLNVDECRDIDPVQVSRTIFPTFKVYKDGAEIDKMVGTSEDGLTDLLERA